MVAALWAAFVHISRPQKYAPPAPEEEKAFSSSCMHALGGGVVGPRGSLLHYDPRCTSELKDYFSGAYFAEVRRVADQAVSYFTQQAAVQDAARRQQQQQGGQQSRGTVVFDIDETALSNLDGFFTSSNWTSGMRSVPCNHPHLEFLELPALQEEGALSWLRKVMPGQEAEASRPVLCSAPPLRAVRDLYHVLLDHDYTVVFLTGRSESDRDATAANLLAAGYGTQCGAPVAATTTTTTITTTTITTTTTSSVSARATATTGAAAAGAGGRRHRMLQWALPLSKAGAGAEAEAAAGGGGRRLACYAALLMREDGDGRLASVFKAEARGRLVAEGHVLVGNIGDQFSDLVGTDSAVASFKLPNPVYTLL